MNVRARCVLLSVLACVVVGIGIYLWQHSALIEERRESGRLRAQLVDEMQTPDSETTEYLPVYGPDERFDPEHLDNAFYVAVPAEMPLIGKLKLLASKMSWYRFDRLPIEVLRIEEVEGKQIAVVNLVEEGEPHSVRSWSGRYFQGSTGGQITQRTLVQTFLQKDYPGEWIDGVRFYYRGEPFKDEWDHIRMIGTFYRDGTRDLTRPS